MPCPSFSLASASGGKKFPSVEWPVCGSGLKHGRALCPTLIFPHPSCSHGVWLIPHFTLLRNMVWLLGMVLRRTRSWTQWSLWLLSSLACSVILWTNCLKNWYFGQGFFPFLGRNTFISITSHGFSLKERECSNAALSLILPLLAPFKSSNPRL